MTSILLTRNADTEIKLCLHGRCSLSMGTGSPKLYQETFCQAIDTYTCLKTRLELWGSWVQFYLTHQTMTLQGRVVDRQCYFPHSSLSVASCSVFHPVASVPGDPRLCPEQRPAHQILMKSKDLFGALINSCTKLCAAAAVRNPRRW